MAKKHITLNSYFDIENGEQIGGGIAKRDYRIIKKTINWKENEKYKIKDITNECRRNERQFELFERST